MGRKRPMSKRSLFLFSNDNRFRQILHRICLHPVFECIILVAILTSCALAGLDDSNTLTPIAIAETMLNGLFLVECIMKSIAFGFVMGRGAYLKSLWNVVDFIIVCAGVVTSLLLLAGDGNSFDLKALRLLRVLRPLRLIGASSHLRVVLDTIKYAFSPMTHVAVFILIGILFFAILGQQLFQGAFHFVCVNRTTEAIVNPVTVCEGYNSLACGSGKSCMHKWTGPNNGIIGFDNIWMSLLTVFQIITLEDWTKLLYMINDRVGPYFPWMYFVPIIILGSYFSLDLLLGVLSSEYLKRKELAKNTNLLRKQRAKFLSIIQQRIRATLKFDKNHVYAEPNVPETVVDVKDDGENHCWNTDVFSKAKAYLSTVIHSKPFSCFVYINISLNIIVAAAKSKTQTKTTSDILESLMGTTVVLFCLELTLTITESGIKKYFKNHYRKLDFAIVSLSVVEQLLVTSQVMPRLGISCLRAMGLLRMFKGTKIWESFTSLIESFVKCLTAIFSIMLVLFIVILIHALLGNQLFGSLLDNENDIITFNTLHGSLISVFVVLTNDAWTVTLGDIHKAYKEQNGEATAFIPSLYFVSVITVGGFMLLNIFLGIIVDMLSEEIDDQTEQQSVGNAGEKDEKKETETLCGKYETVNKNMLTADTTAQSEHNTDNKNPMCTKDQDIEIPLKENIDHKTTYLKNKSAQADVNEDNTFIEVSLDDNPVALPVEIVSQVSARARWQKINRIYIQSFRHIVADAMRARAQGVSMCLDPSVLSDIPQYNSLVCLSPIHPFRKTCLKIVRSPYFSIVCIFAVIISSLLLALEDPLHQSSDHNYYLSWIDGAFIVFFVIEIMLKIVAYGFIFGHKQCYLRDPMNATDFIVVLVSFINLIFQFVGTSLPVHFQVLRVLRVLRGLRISKTLQRIMNCVWVSMQNIASYFGFYLLLLFIYSVMGLQMYGGKVEADIESSAKDNFDNIFNSFVTMFGIATLDNWANLYRKLINNAADIHPVLTTLYIITFILIVGYLMANIFIGFVVMAFRRERDREGGFKALNKHAQECLSTALNAKQRVRNEPKSWFRQKCYKVATSNYFEYLTLTIIIINTIFIALDHYNQPKIYDTIQTVANVVFTVLFTFECIIKGIAFNAKDFFKDAWCVFDLLVVIGSWLDIILVSTKVSVGINLTALRIFRTLRIVKLVSTGGGMKELLRMFVKSLKQVPAVALLMGFLFFVYAILGMQLFGRTVLSGEDLEDRHTNFHSFGQSILLLLRVTTLDEWKPVMYGYADMRMYSCYGDSESNCGSLLSYPYFITFVMLSNFIIINLILAVIMDNFLYLTRDHSLVSSSHIDKFLSVWSLFDPKGTGKISCHDIVKLLSRLNPPLGFGHFCPRRIIYGKLMSIDVALNEDHTVNFKDLLLLLVLRAIRPEAKNATLQNELKIIKPDMDTVFLERILPTGKRVETSWEIEFKRYCASNVIKLNFRIFVSKIKQMKRMKKVAVCSWSVQVARGDRRDKDKDPPAPNGDINSSSGSKTEETFETRPPNDSKSSSTNNETGGIGSEGRKGVEGAISGNDEERKCDEGGESGEGGESVEDGENGKGDENGEGGEGSEGNETGEGDESDEGGESVEDGENGKGDENGEGGESGYKKHDNVIKNDQLNNSTLDDQTATVSDIKIQAIISQSECTILNVENIQNLYNENTTPNAERDAIVEIREIEGRENSEHRLVKFEIGQDWIYNKADDIKQKYQRAHDGQGTCTDDRLASECENHLACQVFGNDATLRDVNNNEPQLPKGSLEDNNSDSSAAFKSLVIDEGVKDVAAECHDGSKSTTPGQQHGANKGDTNGIAKPIITAMKNNNGDITESSDNESYEITLPPIHKTESTSNNSEIEGDTQGELTDAHSNGSTGNINETTVEFVEDLEGVPPVIKNDHEIMEAQEQITDDDNSTNRVINITERETEGVKPIDPLSEGRTLASALDVGSECTESVIINTQVSEVNELSDPTESPKEAVSDETTPATDRASDTLDTPNIPRRSTAAMIKKSQKLVKKRLKTEEKSCRLTSSTHNNSNRALESSNKYVVVRRVTFDIVNERVRIRARRVRRVQRAESTPCIGGNVNFEDEVARLVEKFRKQANKSDDSNKTDGAPTTIKDNSTTSLVNKQTQDAQSDTRPHDRDSNAGSLSHESVRDTQLDKETDCQTKSNNDVGDSNVLKANNLERDDSVTSTSETNSHEGSQSNNAKDLLDDGEGKSKPANVQFIFSTRPNPQLSCLAQLHYHPRTTQERQDHQESSTTSTGLEQGLEFPISESVDNDSAAKNISLGSDQTLNLDSSQYTEQSKDLEVTDHPDGDTDNTDNHTALERCSSTNGFPVNNLRQAMTPELLSIHADEKYSDAEVEETECLMENGVLSADTFLTDDDIKSFGVYDVNSVEECSESASGIALEDNDLSSDEIWPFVPIYDVRRPASALRVLAENENVNCDMKLPLENSSGPQSLQVRSVQSTRVVDLSDEVEVASNECILDSVAIVHQNKAFLDISGNVVVSHVTEYHQGSVDDSELVNTGSIHQISSMISLGTEVRLPKDCSENDNSDSSAAFKSLVIDEGVKELVTECQDGGKSTTPDKQPGANEGDTSGIDEAIITAMNDNQGDNGKSSDNESSEITLLPLDKTESTSTNSDIEGDIQGEQTDANSNGLRTSNIKETTVELVEDLKRMQPFIRNDREIVEAQEQTVLLNGCQPQPAPQIICTSEDSGQSSITNDNDSTTGVMDITECNIEGVKSNDLTSEGSILACALDVGSECTESVIINTQVSEINEVSDETQSPKEAECDETIQATDIDTDALDTPNKPRSSTAAMIKKSQKLVKKRLKTEEKSCRLTSSTHNNSNRALESSNKYVVVRRVTFDTINERVRIRARRVRRVQRAESIPCIGRNVNFEDEVARLVEKFRKQANKSDDLDKTAVVLTTIESNSTTSLATKQTHNAQSNTGGEDHDSNADSLSQESLRDTQIDKETDCQTESNNDVGVSNVLKANNLEREDPVTFTRETKSREGSQSNKAKDLLDDGEGKSKPANVQFIFSTRPNPQLSCLAQMHYHPKTNKERQGHEESSTTSTGLGQGSEFPSSVSVDNNIVTNNVSLESDQALNLDSSHCTEESKDHEVTDRADSDTDNSDNDTILDRCSSTIGVSLNDVGQAMTPELLPIDEDERYSDAEVEETEYPMENAVLSADTLLTDDDITNFGAYDLNSTEECSERGNGIALDDNDSSSQEIWPFVPIYDVRRTASALCVLDENQKGNDCMKLLLENSSGPQSLQVCSIQSTQVADSVDEVEVASNECILDSVAVVHQNKAFLDDSDNDVVSHDTEYHQRTVDDSEPGNIGSINQINSRIGLETEAHLPKDCFENINSDRSAAFRSLVIDEGVKEVAAECQDGGKSTTPDQQHGVNGEDTNVIDEPDITAMKNNNEDNGKSSDNESSEIRLPLLDKTESTSTNSEIQGDIQGEQTDANSNVLRAGNIKEITVELMEDLEGPQSVINNDHEIMEAQEQTVLFNGCQPQSAPQLICTPEDSGQSPITDDDNSTNGVVTITECDTEGVKPNDPPSKGSTLASALDVGSECTESVIISTQVSEVNEVSDETESPKEAVSDETIQATDIDTDALDTPNKPRCSTAAMIKKSQKLVKKRLKTEEKSCRLTSSTHNNSNRALESSNKYVVVRRVTFDIVNERVRIRKRRVRRVQRAESTPCIGRNVNFEDEVARLVEKFRKQANKSDDFDKIDGAPTTIGSNYTISLLTKQTDDAQSDTGGDDHDSNANSLSRENLRDSQLDKETDCQTESNNDVVVSNVSKLNNLEKEDSVTSTSKTNSQEGSHSNHAKDLLNDREAKSEPTTVQFVFSTRPNPQLSCLAQMHHHPRTTQERQGQQESSKTSTGSGQGSEFPRRVSVDNDSVANNFSLGSDQALNLDSSQCTEQSKDHEVTDHADSDTDDTDNDTVLDRCSSSIGVSVNNLRQAMTPELLSIHEDERYSHAEVEETECPMENGVLSADTLLTDNDITNFGVYDLNSTEECSESGNGIVLDDNDSSSDEIWPFVPIYDVRRTASALRVLAENENVNCDMKLSLENSSDPQSLQVCSVQSTRVVDLSDEVEVASNECILDSVAIVHQNTAFLDVSGNIVVSHVTEYHQRSVEDSELVNTDSIHQINSMISLRTEAKLPKDCFENSNSDSSAAFKSLVINEGVKDLVTECHDGGKSTTPDQQHEASEGDTNEIDEPIISAMNNRDNGESSDNEISEITLPLLYKTETTSTNSEIEDVIQGDQTDANSNGVLTGICKETTVELMEDLEAAYPKSDQEIMKGQEQNEIARLVDKFRRQANKSDNFDKTNGASTKMGFIFEFREPTSLATNQTHDAQSDAGRDNHNGNTDSLSQESLRDTQLDEGTDCQAESRNDVGVSNVPKASNLERVDSVTSTSETNILESSQSNNANASVEDGKGKSEPATVQFVFSTRPNPQLSCLAQMHYYPRTTEERQGHGESSKTSTGLGQSSEFSSSESVYHEGVSEFSLGLDQLTDIDSFHSAEEYQGEDTEHADSDTVTVTSTEPSNSDK